MEHIGSIFSGVILPIFFLLGIGFLMQQKFQLDLYTLSKINIYYLSPAIVFSKLYTSNLPLSLFGGVLLFSASLAVIMDVISNLVGKISRLNPRNKRLSPIACYSIARRISAFPLTSLFSRKIHLPHRFKYAS